LALLYIGFLFYDCGLSFISELDEYTTFVFSEYQRRKTLKANEMKERTTPFKSDPKDDIPEDDEHGEENKENKIDESFKGRTSLRGLILSCVTIVNYDASYDRNRQATALSHPRLKLKDFCFS